MNYFALKTIHVTAVALSFAGFFARGLGSFASARWVRHPLTRTLPHVVDSVLLASALALVWIAKLTPATAPWLLAKVVGLLLYIGLGIGALGRARTTRWRFVAWLAALATFGYIVSVAITKNPLGVFGLV